MRAEERESECETITEPSTPRVGTLKPATTRTGKRGRSDSQAATTPSNPRKVSRGPVNPGRRQDQFKAMAVPLVERPLAKGCDIVGGDWNEIVTASDHHRHRAPVESRRAEMIVLIDRLGGENQLVDGWKEMYPGSMTFFRGSQGISRIDKIYIRSDWLRKAKGWDIRPSGLQTDHHAVTTLPCLPRQVHRGPGRWRQLNPALLKLSGVMCLCVSVLQAFRVRTRSQNG
jgi:hypothetical protein